MARRILREFPLCKLHPGRARPTLTVRDSVEAEMNRRLLIAFLLFDLVIVGGVLLWIFDPLGWKGGHSNPGPGKPEVIADPSLAVAPPKVKLAVLVVFDQMRGDYVDRWRPL